MNPNSSSSPDKEQAPKNSPEERSPKEIAKLILDEKMHALGVMVSGVAHELNNPLTAIVGNAQLLMGSANISPAEKERLQVIVESVMRCKSIIEYLFIFAGNSATQHVDLNHLVASAINLKRYEMSANNVLIMEDYDPQIPPIMANAPQLQMAFFNIVVNSYDAIKERSEGGTLVVWTQKEADVVSVSFEDDAGGMKEPDKVFDPFYTTRQPGQGMGLGLSTAYGIVRDHGGTISAVNNGRGATFTVKLPLVRKAGG